MKKEPAGRSRVLPTLRQDLEIRPGAASASGEPMWVISDTLRHKFIQIDGETRLLLSVWKDARTVDDLVTLASERYGLQADGAAAIELAEFVRRHHLSEDTSDEEWRQLMKVAEGARHSMLQKLLHNYLFLLMLKRSLPVRQKRPLTSTLTTRPSCCNSS
jgi:hypothetical protein